MHPRTPTPRTVTIHGHDVSVLVAGQDTDPVSGNARPCLLLIHGMAGSADTWRDVIGPLSERFLVVAPDLLGHGRSDKPRHDYSLGSFASMLRDLLTTLGVDRATVVGQSLGGGIALQFAYQYPERCDRLVLVDSGGLGREVSVLLRAFTLPGSEYLMPVLFPPFVRDTGNAVSRWLYDRGVRAPSVAEQWRSYLSLTHAENRDAFVHTLRSVVDPGGQTVSALDRLYLAEHLPTHIIWGDRDRIIPVSHGYEAHEAMPGSTLDIFEDCAHYPQNEHPARFVQSITTFIDTTQPGLDDPSAWQARLVSGAPGVSGTPGPDAPLV